MNTTRFLLVCLILFGFTVGVRGDEPEPTWLAPGTERYSHLVVFCGKGNFKPKRHDELYEKYQAERFKMILPITSGGFRSWMEKGRLFGGILTDNAPALEKRLSTSTDLAVVRTLSLDEKLYKEHLARKDESTVLKPTGIPKIVLLDPPDRETRVDPTGTRLIRIIFDTDMDTSRFGWSFSGNQFPRIRGQSKWLDARTCVLPVEVAERGRYFIGINSPENPGFRSAEGIPAEAAQFSFYTKDSNVTLSPRSRDDSRNEKWRSDLIWLRDTLPRMHPNLFFRLPAGKYAGRMNNLIAAVPKVTDRDLKRELYKLFKEIGDTHSSIRFVGEKYWPISFFIFEDGVFVDGIDARFKEFYARKLIAVNGMPVREVLERLNKLKAGDNKTQRLFLLSGMLKNGALLYLAEIGDSEDSVEYSFGDTVLKWLSESLNCGRWEGWLPRPEDKLFSQQDDDKNYWFKWIDGKNLYVKYNSCRDMKDYPLSAFLGDVFVEIREKNPGQLILDLRNNNGGSDGIFSPFFQGMSAFPALNTPKRFKVIIGRETFSAAMNNATDLRLRTNALFVGEPAGHRPSHFGDVHSIALTNVRATVGYSTKYIRKGDEKATTLVPDVSIPLRSADWFGGRDPFLEAALKQ